MADHGWAYDSSDAQQIAEQFLAKFPGRDDYMTVFDPEGDNKPHNVVSFDGDDFDEHIHAHAHQSYGAIIHPLRDDGTISFACIRVDATADSESTYSLPKREVQAIVDGLAKLGLPCLVERSTTRRHYKLWLTFQVPVPASYVRRILAAVIATLPIRKPDLVPDCDKLQLSQVAVGALLPLYEQSRILDPSDFRERDPISAISDLCQITGAMLQDAADSLGIDLTEYSVPTCTAFLLEQQIALPETVLVLVGDPYSKFSERWNGSLQGLTSTSLSSHAMSLITMLVMQFVPDADIAVAIREWCRVHQFNKAKDDAWLSNQIRSAHAFVSKRFRAAKRG